MFLLRLLGRASIEGPSGAVTGKAARRHALALLALLATSHSRRLSRDKLIGYLWPESGTSDARNLLNQSVHALRQALGSEAIRSEGEELVLNPDSLSCDVWTFEEALASGETERALDLYRGPFLDGFFVRGSVEFERWADVERERLRRAYLRAMEGLAEAATARDDLKAAADWWRRLAGEEPYNSNVILSLMRVLEAAGDRAGAIREAEAHAERLREDLEAAPNPEVLALAERMRRQPVAPSPAPAVPAAPTTSVEAARHGRPARQPTRMPMRSAPARTIGILRSRWTQAAILAAGLALLVVAARALLNSPASDVEARRVAVLPLANLTGDPQQEYFVAGMHDALVTELGQIAGLTVISRQSVIRYQDSDLPLPVIARQLDVQALVEGSVFLVGDSVRINVQLVRAEPEEHLWADAYYGELPNALALQGEVARAIARAIGVRVRSAPPSRSTSGLAVDSEAQEAYLRGLYLLERLANTAAMSDSQRAETRRSAVAYLKKAVALEPEWAAAHTGLARAYYELVNNPPVEGNTEEEFFPKAKAEALVALDLDEARAQAHAVLGFVELYYEWDWTAAERSIRRALDLDPSAYNHWAYADFLRAVGRYDEALVQYQVAEERNPLSEILKLWISRTYSCVGRHRDAIAKLEQVRALLGDDATWLVGLYLGFEYLAESMPARALAELEASVALSGGDPTAIEGLAYGYARAGRLDKARELASRLEQQPHPEAGAWTLLLAAMGETDRAVARLKADVEARRSAIPDLRCTYTYRELQDDPRIQELVRRIGYPQ
jgi:DNA-binding SARP family transcriptional activator/TolB-like protein/Tfp pilus assembly protein PilF